MGAKEACYTARTAGSAGTWQVVDGYVYYYQICQRNVTKTVKFGIATKVPSNCTMTETEEYDGIIYYHYQCKTNNIISDLDSWETDGGFIQENTCPSYNIRDHYRVGKVLMPSYIRKCDSYHWYLGCQRWSYRSVLGYERVINYLKIYTQ